MTKSQLVNQRHPLLEVTSLKKHFPVRKGVFSRPIGHIKAVDGVSFRIHRGRTLGLVGESGSGKTTTGLATLRLVAPTGGQILFAGKSLLDLDSEGLRQIRKRMQIIFQDPYGSLNPRSKIGRIIEEPFRIHGIGTRKERSERVKELLEKVGLSPNQSDRYPHEFSGGQRQRIGIARAIALRPELIICDEPVSALDVSVRAQIINLLEDLQGELNLSYLFIAHDLSVVKHISDEVAVMYMGRIVEQADSRELYSNPLHPYTQTLLSAIPVPDPKRAALAEAKARRSRTRPFLNGGGSPPPRGCSFAPRCPLAEEQCGESNPKMRELAAGHYVRCFRVGDLGRTD